MSTQIKAGLDLTVKLAQKVFNSGFLFLPFTSLHPLRLYLSLATLLIIYRDRSTLRKVLALFVCLLVDLLKNLYLSLAFPPNPLDRVRLADIVYITTGENFTYRIWILLQALLLYILYILATVKPVFLAFLESLLFSKAEPLFERNGAKSRSPLKNCRQSALWTLNLLGLLKIICNILFLLVCTSMFHKALHCPEEFLGNPGVSPFLFACRILQMIIGLSGLFLLLFLYATVCPNVAAVGCATLTLLFLRLHFNAKLLTAWKVSLKSHFTWTPLTRYRATSLATFSLLFLANETLGPIFVAFLVVNVPISAFCFVYLALGGLHLRTRLTFGLLMWQGLNCTLLLHLFLAKLTKRLHAPSKRLLALSSATSHRVGNFRARLALYLTICHLHTKRQYGFTYGPFGLVTMGSFSKCMLIYCKFIIFSYKLIQSI